MRHSCVSAARHGVRADVADTRRKAFGRSVKAAIARGVVMSRQLDGVTLPLLRPTDTAGSRPVPVSRSAGGRLK